jgi:hypothetical protein
LGLPLIAAVATILVAATIDPDANSLRLRAMPRQERQRLIDNLQKFDLIYTVDEQSALRDLDRKINELDPVRRAQYVRALRTYHNWFNRLPEMKQAELKDKSPGERMAVVKKLLADHPVAPNSNPRLIQFIDVGDHTPFEVAAVYEIWQGLSPGERQQVEKMAPGTRRQNLLKRGEKKKPANGVKSADFDEPQSIAQFKAWVRRNRPALLAMFENDADHSEILRRQAINFHFLEMKNNVKFVTPDHLAEFLASFPPWLRSSFDHYPPDEARRRLSVVYRLVFPPGVEIKVGPAAASPPAGGVRSKAAAPRATPGPEGKTPSEPASSPF